MAKAKKLPSGSWRVRVYDHTDSAGKKHYKSFTCDDKSSKGKAKCEKMAAEWVLTRTKIEKSSPIKFEDAVENYINERSNILSPASIKKYRVIQRQLDCFNGYSVYDITQDVLQRYVNDLSVKYSPKYISDRYGFIVSVVKRYNPSVAFSVVLPRKQKYDRYIPNNEEAERLYKDVKGSEMELPILLASMAMMRRSEICALSKSDFDGNVIHIHKAMVTTPQNEWVVKSPKTYSGDRYVEVIPYITELFMALPGDTIGITPNIITDRFEHIRNSLELPYFRFHDLRAMGASIRHALGYPDLYVMGDAGWSNDRMLKEIYGKPMNDFRKQLDGKLFNYYNGMIDETEKDYTRLRELLNELSSYQHDQDYLNWLGKRKNTLDNLLKFSNGMT